MAPLLAYHDLRGLCEPIRYLLHYKGVDFEDKRYKSFDEWQKDKFNLNLRFPNLPYYIDGDVRLTQSLAILRHLARKHGLAGSTEEERIELELVEQQLIDLRTDFIRTCYSPDFEKIKYEFIKNLPTKFDLWSLYLGDKQFLVGDKVTYVDFMAYDIFDFYEYLAATQSDFPTLNEYKRRIRNLPELQSYFASATYKTWPLLGPCASFGGKGEEPKKK